MLALAYRAPMNEKDKTGYWSAARRRAFGERLAAARAARGFTLEKVAEAFESGRARVGHWETGARLPDAAALAQLCDLLAISADKLLLGAEPWPFKLIDLDAVKRLTRDEKNLLEGAIVGAAHQLGLAIDKPAAQNSTVNNVTPIAGSAPGGNTLQKKGHQKAAPAKSKPKRKDE